MLLEAIFEWGDKIWWIWSFLNIVGGWVLKSAENSALFFFETFPNEFEIIQNF